MKIVLDTNIFVSAYFHNGNPRKVYHRIVNGLDELYITDDILTELYKVLLRKKFDIGINEVEDFVNIVESYSEKVICQNEPENISRDKDDDKILQCGLEGNVDYIITGDKDLLVLDNYKSIRIINASEYLNIVL
jgi:putative PIN family toxin of toxin-antitoxin system